MVGESLRQRADRTANELLAHVEAGGRLTVVQAPPGSGKTYLLTQAIARASAGGLRIAVATQTNAQADDICRRLGSIAPPVACVRFANKNRQQVSLGPHVRWITETAHVPLGPNCTVVATTAKWSMIDVAAPFDVLFVEEAWQVAWADFMPLGQVAPRFVLIGDPGQIAPVVTVDTSRWETSPVPPHLAAPTVIEDHFADRALSLRLPATRRLPHDSAALVQPFYDFEFGAFAGPGDRRVIPTGTGRTAVDGAIDRLGTGSIVAMAVPTPPEGPPLERDDVLAAAAVRVVERLLERQVDVVIDGHREPLRAEHIGLCATHHVMNSALQLGLPSRIRQAVRVDTPERWQGLERQMMIVIHPLSGRARPTDFDLDTGRLCVMASRHQVGLVILTRDHLTGTLHTHLPSARQAVGRPDVEGKGHNRNARFWSALVDGDRLVA